MTTSNPLDPRPDRGSDQVGDIPRPPSLEAHLRAQRAAGRKLLLPYITGGFPVGEWPQLIEGLATVGADALEIGIPFSDPVMDGPTIQESSSLALEAGANPMSILAEVAKTDPGIPLIAMTYYNICFRMGHERFASSLLQSGISAAILPDLPLEEIGPWAEVADDAGVETVLLAAPTAPDERLPRIVARTRGFVYGVGLVGITGERDELAGSALEMARRLKAITDMPVVVGVGVSTPEQAAEVCQVADGVVVGSAVIRRLLDRSRIDDAVELVADIRSALDSV
jgi:tryptophan synthase alpha chain